MKKLLLVLALLVLGSRISMAQSVLDQVNRTLGLERPKDTLNSAAKTVGIAKPLEDLDRMRLEAQAQAGAPAFEQALIQSRNTALNGASPIPPQMQAIMAHLYDQDVLNRVRYKIGDNGAINAANLLISHCNAEAVTLVDVIVFKTAADAQNPRLWAHELKHVQQFRDWGTRNFAIRYLRSWNGVEGDAYAVQNGAAVAQAVQAEGGGGQNNGNLPQGFAQAPPNFVPVQPQLVNQQPIGRAVDNFGRPFVVVRQWYSNGAVQDVPVY